MCREGFSPPDLVPEINCGNSVLTELTKLVVKWHCQMERLMELLTLLSAAKIEKELTSADICSRVGAFCNLQL